MRRHSTGYDFLFFTAIAATLISLAPGLAHLVELPRKMALSRDTYFTVQQIYSGWALFGISILVQLIAISLLAFRSMGDHHVFRAVVAALLLLIAAQALFWFFTFPANTATQNWTVMPADWQALRRQWEYSHLGAAVCQAAGFFCLIGALFARIQAAGR
jgi:hypothetical protein